MKTEILSELPVPTTDQTIIVKGKRTKRPRPSSDSSPATSSASTEEDEDMANCLILLARGNTPWPPPQNQNTTQEFAEMATTTAAARVGIYVYECKTCSRTFPSFQALGGHRASHKRPKLDQEDKQSGNCKLNCTAVAPPPAPNKIADQSKLPKIHECSICGSEFASGQALGGHMRRHRAPTISVEKPRNVLALDFDLNLPAPAEVDDMYNKQPRIIVFSAAALVDCHY